ncbi:MAG: glycosyltransferase [Planctomycetes bacterium]|nr:glycosyltransferase [Planctomycetota bacterium]
MPTALRPIRSISVLMPTWQGAEFLERVLASLAEQRCALPWDFLAIDSGSTDGTLEILARRARDFPVPLRVESIDKVEFDHGDTRNLLASQSGGDLLVFLTQDAIPVGPDWLARLAANFDGERGAAVGAAYCRNVARPDARPSTRLLSAGDPGYLPGRREVRLPPPDEYARLSAHEKRVLYNFNDVASALRRELWELYPFPRTWFGEDVLLARALLEADWTVVYDDAATVEHSHDYDARETRERARIDGRFNAEWLDRVCIASTADARTLCERLAAGDARAIAAAGFSGAQARELEREMAGLREAAFLGLHEGGQSKLRRAGSALLTRRSLSILYVVHGFMPDTWAGTEIYTLELAKAMQRRGHRVAILARGGAERSEEEGGPREASIEEYEFEGLRVLRHVHRLRHRNLRESFSKSEPEQMFRAVLAREKPDLVHFQHLIHASIGLPGIAKERGLPTLLHCHDYWALCSRVQMIRPDGQRCDDNMGAGCYLCVKERWLEHVPLARRVGALSGPLAPLVASSVGQQEFADLAERHKAVPAAYQQADLLISPSRFLRRKLLDSPLFEGTDPHRFLYSDNGLRIDHLQALAKRPDPGRRIRFGFIGTLAWYKGGRVLIEALAKLKGERVALQVWGSFDPARDAHHAELAALVQSSGAPVEFRGRFPNERLSDVYAEIDVLVVPSIWYENSPITIHEAWLARTPVLASRLGGMAEFVREGVDGLLFEPGNADDLAAVMRRFVAEPDLVERLSRRFPSPKTIDANAAELEFRYRGLVAARRRPASALLLDVPAVAADRRSEAVLPQGADLLLLRPGGGAVEFDLDCADAERISIELELFVLGPEREVELGGRVLLDGVELAQIPLQRSEGRDETRRFRCEAALTPRAEGDARRVLRLECAIAPGGPEAHLRLARVRVREQRVPIGGAR